VNIVNESDNVPESQILKSKLSSYKTSGFEHDDSAGVVSPSDLRRPRESSHIKVVGDSYSNAGSHGGNPNAVAAHFHGSPGSFSRTVLEGEKVPESKDNSESRRREVLHQDFMKSFLTDETHFQGTIAGGKESSKEWRQTALQRRASSRVIAQPPITSSFVVSSTDSEAVPGSPAISIPSPQVSTAVLGDQSSEARSTMLNRLQREENPPIALETDQKEVPSPTRSASEILNQLPKEDIDFISAADIRASMGSRRSKLPSSEERQAERQKLEQTFTKAQQADLDSMIEANIINDQHVRRTEREMREAQRSQEAKETQSAQNLTDQTHAVEPAMESSIDRMTKWLETTGTNFVKQFWQDPTEEADITKTRLFFDKVMHYIRKGRLAMQPIVEDLEKDIPASTTLLRRLNSDEKALELAIHQLRQRSANGLAQGLTPRKVKAMESLKVRFQQTNNELEKAYAALREVATTEVVAKAPASFKRRLSMASKVLHKNAQLSRMLVYSLQTRLEDPNVDRKLLTNYKPVADNLLSLRDTQMTLIRLVDHAMLVYGIVPKSVNDVNAKGQMYDDNGLAEKQAQEELANCEEPFVRARLAADAHLIDVIKAHKAAPQVASFDEGSQPAKAAPNTTLDEPRPLAHSLFRPFGPVFEKLGKEEEPPYSVAEPSLGEVTASFHGTPGAKQAAETAAHDKVSKKNFETLGYPVKSFEMLKDDPAANTIETNDAVTNLSSHDNGRAAISAMSNNNMSLPEDSIAALAPETLSTNAVAPDVTEPANTVVPTPSNTPNPQPEVPTAAPSTISTAHLPTHYTILVHDPQTGALSITTSTTGPPRDTSPALPLHQALSSLDSPAKFIPYITPGLEVVTAKKDMLILRDAIDTNSSTHTFETITPRSGLEDFHRENYRDTMNPIDGTARLSPTGYVGPEESPEQLEKEFDERRHAAGQLSSRLSMKEEESAARSWEEHREKKWKKAKRTGGAGRVIRTAIWAAALCYVVGVGGEIALRA
jgi:hypothetical protein